MRLLQPQQVIRKQSRKMIRLVKRKKIDVLYLKGEEYADYKERN